VGKENLNIQRGLKKKPKNLPEHNSLPLISVWIYVHCQKRGDRSPEHWNPNHFSLKGGILNNQVCLGKKKKGFSTCSCPPSVLPHPKEAKEPLLSERFPELSSQFYKWALVAAGGQGCYSLFFKNWGLSQSTWCETTSVMSPISTCNTQKLIITSYSYFLLYQL
jgi:hypothetical protein